MKLKKLKEISYWVRKLSNQGNDDPDINTLDTVTLHDLVVEMNAKEEDIERDSLDLKPKDFDAKDFDDWSKSFIVYLDSIAGGAGTPLSYVVRSEDADPDDATNAQDGQIWSARLDGPIFEKDNLVVHCALHNLLISTSRFPWFEQAPDGDGRAAFKALTDHYRVWHIRTCRRQRPTRFWRCCIGRTSSFILLTLTSPTLQRYSSPSKMQTKKFLKL